MTFFCVLFESRDRSFRSAMVILDVSFDPFWRIIFGFAVEVTVEIDEIHSFVGSLEILYNSSIGNLHQYICK